MKAVIFGGGEIKDYSFCGRYISGADIIICCDRGMHHARELGLTPDYILGDFDSVSRGDYDYFKAAGISFEQFPCNKDYTDMELGAEKALELGADEVILLGGIGSRLDHTLGNINLCAYLLKRGVSAALANENNELRLINREFTVKGRRGGIVSLIPYTPVVSGITLKGFEYELENGTMEQGGFMGVSNVAVSDAAEISIGSGCLIMLFSEELGE